MLLAALRDLQWRRRRVAITVIGTGLLLAMTLVLTGLSASFRVEAHDVRRSVGRRLVRVLEPGHQSLRRRRADGGR